MLTMSNNESSLQQSRPDDNRVASASPRQHIDDVKSKCLTTTLMRKPKTMKSLDSIKITNVRSLHSTHLAKISNFNEKNHILTPIYREDNHLMTIGDNVETITEEDGANEGRLSLAERLCDQQLDIPDENGPESYKYNPSIVPPPPRLIENRSNLDNLPLQVGIPSSQQGLPVSTFSPYIVELFRRGIDINDQSERIKLDERLQNSQNDAEKSSILAYIRIFETKQCEYCNYNSKDRDSIKRHISNVHLKEKPFPCDECDASFGRKDKLKRHKQCLHSDERPFMCDFCEYSCKRQDKLRLHTHRVHYKHAYQLPKPSSKTARKYNPITSGTTSSSQTLLLPNT